MILSVRVATAIAAIHRADFCIQNVSIRPKSTTRISMRR